jgi:hypothetical protein
VNSMATKRRTGATRRPRRLSTALPEALAGLERVVYSGGCLCGHALDDHHCQMVQDPRVAEILGSTYGPDVCEFYGSNEEAGLDEAGELHCLQYVDRDEPNPQRRAMWAAKLEEARRRQEEDRAIAEGDPAAIEARDQRVKRALRRLKARRQRRGRGRAP